MPKISPLRLEKYQPVGLSSLDIGSRISVGAGTVDVPRVPKPVYQQYIAEETAYGARLGEQTANAITEVSNAAIQFVQAQKSAEGMREASILNKKYADEYYGNPKTGTYGIVASQGLTYLDKTADWQTRYDAELAEVSNRLDSFTNSVFLKEAKSQQESLYKTVRTKQAEIKQEVIQDDLKSIEVQKEAGLISDLTNIVETYAGNEEVLKAKLNEWKTNVGLEWYRRVGISGLETQEQDKLAYSLLQRAYNEGGRAIAKYVEDDLISQIKDPEKRVKAKTLYAEFVKNDYAVMQEIVEARAIQEKYQNYENHSKIVAELKQYSNPADATELIRKYGAESLAQAKYVQTLIDLWFNENSLDIRAVGFMADNLGDHPRDIIERAQRQGISLNPTALNQMSQFYLSTRKEESKNYTKLLEGRIKSYVKSETGIFGNFFEGSRGKAVVDELVNRFSLFIMKPGNRDVPLPTLYTKFLEENINPQLFDSTVWDFPPENSFIEYGVYKKLNVEPDQLKSYTDLARQFISINRDFFYTLDDQEIDNMATHLINTAQKADSGESGAKDTFWQFYKYMQLNSITMANVPENRIRYLQKQLLDEIPVQSAYLAATIARNFEESMRQEAANQQPQQPQPGNNVLNQGAQILDMASKGIQTILGTE